LESVNITKCPGLTHVSPGTFSDLPYLTHLNLHGNKLSSLAEGTADWYTVGHVDLAGNPIRQANIKTVFKNSI
jgi:hypothetical protein